MLVASPALSATLVTMTHDSTPRRVFEIDELTRLIASQLVLISRQSTVNLACTCRSLEEPNLSTLWETQSSMSTLLGVLPKETWKTRYREYGECVFKIVGDPSPEDWSRVWRYASWMRKVSLDYWTPLGEETSKKLRSNSPPGGWFPALRDLSWCMSELSVLHVDLFLSPRLQRISISASWSWNSTGVTPAILQTLIPIISTLPTSSLERISVDTDHLTMPWERLKDTFSSIILRCGPSFTEYDSPVPLSNAALDHLVHLPRLRTWRIHGPPPTYPTSSFPLIFPPLRELTFGEGATRRWLPLLGGLEDDASTTQAVTPLSKVKGSLETLNIDEDMYSIRISAPSIFPIQHFRNLVHLNVEVSCHDGDDRGDCIFDLNNDDVAKLTMALTQLESLLLGHPCFENTCFTTVACLLPISVHCSKLKKLEIHFDTTDIVDDFRGILENPRLQQLRLLPKCPLTSLGVHQLPLELSDVSGLETVVKGMIDIFPYLKHFERLEEECQPWDELAEDIADFRKDSL